MLDYLCIHVLVHCLVSNANITGLYEPRVGRYLERSFSLPFLGFFYVFALCGIKAFVH